MAIRVAKADLSDPAVRDLIDLHQRGMLDESPPGTSFALNISGLSGPEITLFGAWDGQQLLGIGALKRLTADQAEIKSMRTHPDHVGKGIGRAILEAIITTAQSEGITRLSLETGTNEHFAPAIALYTRRGFAAGEAFAGYANGLHNQCYHLAL